MASWSKKAAKLASGATGGAAARIADLAQQAAGKQMTRREFLQKVGALAGSAALKKVPVPDAPPAPPVVDFGPLQLERTVDDFALAPGLERGFSTPLGQILWTPHGPTLPDEEKHALNALTKQEFNDALGLMRKAAAAPAPLPDQAGLLHYNHLTNSWHPQLAEVTTIPQGQHFRLIHARANVPSADIESFQPWATDAIEPWEWEQLMESQPKYFGTLTTPGKEHGRTVIQQMQRDWRSARAQELERGPHSRQRRMELLDDLELAPGGRANDPMPPTAMQRHPLGMESMGLPGDEERDAFGRVRRVMGVALPLGAAAAGSNEPKQPRLLGGLRAN